MPAPSFIYRILLGPEHDKVPTCFSHWCLFLLPPLQVIAVLNFELTIPLLYFVIFSFVFVFLNNIFGFAVFFNTSWSLN